MGLVRKIPTAIFNYAWKTDCSPSTLQDNGFIQFTFVRVPRSHMLMKHTQGLKLTRPERDFCMQPLNVDPKLIAMFIVSRTGEVAEPPLAQLTYGALLSGRTSMVSDSSNTAKKALTVAIRYAAVRRQFSSGGNTTETQILDYPIHQRRLMVSSSVSRRFML